MWGGGCKNKRKKRDVIINERSLMGGASTGAQRKRVRAGPEVVGVVFMVGGATIGELGRDLQL